MEPAAAYRTPSQTVIPLYRLSGRPQTTMPFVRLTCRPGRYLPVSRYEDLFHKQSTDPEKYCGTFYFYEPESPFYLNLGSTFVASSKYGAMREFERRLYGDFDEIKALQQGTYLNLFSLCYLLNVVGRLDTVLEESGLAPEVPEPTFQYLPENIATLQRQGLLTFSPQEPEVDQMLRAFNPHMADTLNMEIRENNETWSRNIKARSEPNRILYLASQPNFYHSTVRVNKLYQYREFLTTMANSALDLRKISIEAMLSITVNALGQAKHTADNYELFTLDALGDIMDQSLCHLGRYLGYDTILLQREFGRTKVATEILDTRPRNETYQQFCHRPSAEWKYNVEMPIIWTPDLGFLQLS